jgi:hypothetical protein
MLTFRDSCLELVMSNSKHLDKPGSTQSLVSPGKLFAKLPAYDNRNNALIGVADNELTMHNLHMKLVVSDGWTDRQTAWVQLKRGRTGLCVALPSTPRFIERVT